MNHFIRSMGLGVSVSLAVLLAAIGNLRAVQPTNGGQTAAAGAQAFPKEVRFSGVLQDAAGVPLTGVQGVTFALYAEQAGGAPLWLETQNVTADEQGRYAVLLGAMRADGLPQEVFTSNEARWLGVRVNLPGAEEQARVLLVSVPYALKAADAETLGGRPVSAFLLAADQVTARVEASGGLAAATDGLPTAALTTPGQIAKIVDSSGGVGDSIITETSGGKIGVGTNSPNRLLEVSQDANADIGFRVANPNSGSGTQAMMEFYAGRVGSPGTVDQHFLFSAGPALEGATIVNTRNVLGGTRAGDLYLGFGDFPNLPLVIKPSGNVGIGTSSAARSLEIGKDVNADIGLRISNANSGSGTQAMMEFYAGRVGSPGTVDQHFLFSAGPALEGATIVNTRNSLGGTRAGELYFGFGDFPNLPFVIKRNGNVGIGITAPTAKLDVVGDLKVSGSVTAASFAGDGTGLTNLNATNISSGTLSVARGGTGVTTAQGNGSKVQLSTGTTTTDNCVKFDANGNTVDAGAPCGGVSGSGTANKLPKFTAATTLGDSKVSDDGTNVTIDVTGGGFKVLADATSPNIVGGYSGNTITAGAVGATVSGGGSSANTNRVTDDYGAVGGGWNNQAGDNTGATNDRQNATVGGGLNNTASGASSTVAGGNNNTASGTQSTVGGGSGNAATGLSTTIAGGFNNQATLLTATVGGGAFNIASGQRSAVGGGDTNVASANHATVAGGLGNTASGLYATVPGGRSNTALGEYSLAVGRRAKANNQGSFVWGDSTDVDFASTANDQFLIRASGGVGIGTNGPTEMLQVAGNFKLTGGGNGVIFADATKQTTAASSNVNIRGINFINGCDFCSALADTDDQKTIYQNVIGAMTISSVTCFTDDLTVPLPTINLQRDDSSPLDILAAPLTCDGVANSSFNANGLEHQLALGNKIDFLLVAANGAKRVTVVIKAVVQ